MILLKEKKKRGRRETYTREMRESSESRIAKEPF